LALAAQIQLDSVERERWLPLEDFFWITARPPCRGEFIRTVRVPEPRSDAIDTVKRLFILTKVSKSLMMMISCGGLGASGFSKFGTANQILDCRLAYAAMAPTPKRARSAEAALARATLTCQYLPAIALAEDFSPCRTCGVLAGLRAQVAGNYCLRRALLNTVPAADSDNKLM